MGIQDISSTIIPTNSINQGGRTIKKLLSNTTIDHEVNRRLAELKQVREQLERELKNSPSGKIHVAKSGKRIQYYLRETPMEKTGVYLGADKKKEIKLYLQKRYDEQVLKLIMQEIKWTEKFEKQHETMQVDIQDVFSAMPQSAKKFVEPIAVSDEDYAIWWKNIPFTGKPLPNPREDFCTERGEYVRSKSEILIANMLNRMNIPYRYECPLEIRKGVFVYPDFTVLNVAQRKVMYWEHRGMMDDREYAKYAVQKLKDYGDGGVVLGKNLIITEETSSSPLSTREIKRVIEQFLL